MRKLIILIINIFILILFSYESSLAKTVDEDIIRQIAQIFLKEKSTIYTRALNKQMIYSIDKIEQLNHLTDNSFLAYIIYIQPKGFLIISPLPGNDPVVAYTFNHNWNPNINKNDFIYTLLCLDLNLRKENFKKNPSGRIQSNSNNWKSYFELSESI